VSINLEPRPPGRAGFTLRPSHLGDIEVTTIGAFLRVGSHRFLGVWTLVLDGPCDVLVCGQPGADEAAPDPSPAVAAILHVVHPHEGGRPGALVRPLQYDAFVEALLQIEQELMRACVDRPPAAREVDAAPKEGVRRRSPLSIPPGARLRLRRWPSTELLEAHRYNLRLASFLSARPMSLDELIQASNVERSQCERFLRALNDAGILDVGVRREPSPPAPQAQPTSPVPVPRGAAVERGFIDHLRRRLGMGRPG